jgi:hypothetical protein
MLLQLWVCRAAGCAAYLPIQRLPPSWKYRVLPPILSRCPSLSPSQAHRFCAVTSLALPPLDNLVSPSPSGMAQGFFWSHSTTIVGLAQESATLLCARAPVCCFRAQQLSPSVSPDSPDHFNPDRDRTTCGRSYRPLPSIHTHTHAHSPARPPNPVHTYYVNTSTYCYPRIHIVAGRLLHSYSRQTPRHSCAASWVRRPCTHVFARACCRYPFFFLKKNSLLPLIVSG